MSISRQKKEGGFTIVEFMIATAVFSMVLLVCAYAIVYIGRVYYKGIITNRAQDAARMVIEDMAGAIQFGPRADDLNSFARTSPERTDSGVVQQAICIGRNRYTFAKGVSLGTESGQSQHVLWKDQIPEGSTSCIADAVMNSSTPSGVDGARELLGKNMRVSNMSVTRNGNIFTVRALIAYGDTADLFTDTTFSECQGVANGGQFCATSGFTTNVVKRL